MEIIKKQLNIIIRFYSTIDNQSIVVLYINSSEDECFKLQVRFLRKNINKWDINPLIEFFKKSIRNSHKKGSPLTIFPKIVANEYLVDDSLNDFKKGIQQTEFIFNKQSYRVDCTQKEHPERFHPNFYWLENIGSEEQAIHFGYLIPENPEGKIPLHCIKIYDTSKKFIKELYLFPTHHNSLAAAKKSITQYYLKSRKTSVDQNTQTPPSPPPSPSIFEKACSFLKKKSVSIEEIVSNEAPNYRSIDGYPDLDIPYLIREPDSNNDTEIQTRIDMQAIIAEIVVHLKKPSRFRATGQEKMRLFQELSKAITNDTPLSDIKNRLDSHDAWELLAKHRDPWGPFSFFKGKTYSLEAWHLLKDLIEQSSSTAQAIFAT